VQRLARAARRDEKGIESPALILEWIDWTGATFARSKRRKGQKGFLGLERRMWKGVEKGLILPGG